MVAVLWAALGCHLMIHVERAHTATGEGDVDNLLMQWQNFISQRVHIHSMCEYR